MRRNTVIYQSLMRFLATFNIPIVATLRDSQSYVRSAESGLGLAEMKPQLVAEDWAEWQPMLEWLQQPSKLGAKNMILEPAMQIA